MPNAQVLVVDMVLPMGTVGFSVGAKTKTPIAQLTKQAKDKIDRATIDKYLSPPLRWGFRTRIASNDPQEVTSFDASQVPQLFQRSAK